jgi:spermidine synthase
VRSRIPSLELLVFVVGSSTLGVEIAAARLMAPFFGDSTIVWANTIAIVLVALSVGYWFGGRMADRHPHLRGLCLLVLAASVLLALVPIIAHPFLSLSVDAFDEISVGVFAGSLLGVLVLVALPVLMLGAVSPWAIRLKLRAVEDSGEVAGRMYAISTVGSLVGTFASALLLIPLIGTQRTFVLFALLLALAAVLGLGLRWLPVPAVVAALLAVPVGTIKAAGDGEVIYETETEYQYARVIQYDDGVRRLELNEGQAIHSSYRPESVLTGNYWDGLLVDPFAGRVSPPRRVAMLGNAAGTTARAYGRYFPSTRFDAVEIDGELLDIGRRYFGLEPRPGLREFAEDARPFLRRSADRYDVILVDAYRQPYIPFYMATKEFFSLARSRLAPGGMVAINVGHPESSDTLEKVLSATLRSVFRHVARDPMNETNTILMASDAPITPASLLRASLPRDLQGLAVRAASRLRPGLKGGTVYTDDRAPVEWLVDESLVQYAAGDR